MRLNLDRIEESFSRGESILVDPTHIKEDMEIIEYYFRSEGSDAPPRVREYLDSTEEVDMYELLVRYLYSVLNCEVYWKMTDDGWARLYTNN